MVETVLGRGGWLWGAGLVAGVTAVLLAGCSGEDAFESDPVAPALNAPVPATTAAAEPAAPWVRAPDRRGGALVRSPHDDVLYIADEDHQKLRVVPLPLGSAPAREVALPGRPAQVLALSDRVLVTLRDPGMLLSLSLPQDGLEIRQQVPLAADGWGLAVTPDEQSALVTSAWTRTVSSIDLAAGTVRWAREVAREPRGVAVMPSGDRAYVTHLVGAEITRIDGVTAEAPEIRRVALPAGRFTQPLPGTFEDDETALDASLGYAPLLSSDGSRLFVPRHALGGVGWAPWFGRPVVDVLLTEDDSPLAPARDNPGVSATVHREDDFMVDDLGETVALPMAWTVQPRASAYRRSTDTLLVVSEGHGRVTELDARALDPSLHPWARYELIHNGDDSDRCGAPSGIALSRDEDVAYVWCRTTEELARVELKPESYAAGPDGDPETPTFLALADAPLPEPAATGRRLFYDARSDGHHNRGVSGGLGCAGCHPDGRDDGHVWLERGGGGLIAEPLSNRLERRFGLGSDWMEEPITGSPRQTPMLAGRVEPEGPYGWQADAETLSERVMTGFGIHRWQGSKARTKPSWYVKKHKEQADALAAFLRQGLVPPPIEQRALSDQELHGQALFESTETQCSICHAKDNGFSNRYVYDLPLSRSTLGKPERPRFRAPSLLFVGGTAPYLHDGRHSTLSQLVDGIGHDMGSTADLSAADRDALSAYLATIGLVSGEPSQAQPMASAPWPFPSTAPSAVEPETAEPLATESNGGEPTTVESAGDETARWPTSTTPEPSRAEWTAAPEIAVRHMPEHCHAWRVREWVRIQCIPGVRESHGLGTRSELQRVFRVAQVAGEQRDVTLRIETRTGWSGEGVAVFPLRRGDRRLIEIDRQVVTETCWRWAEWFMAATFTISASWTGEQPELVISRYGRHPSTGVRIIGQCQF